MPLLEGCSREVISENIRRLISEGYPPDQAAAIAYSKCRRHERMDNHARKRTVDLIRAYQAIGLAKRRKKLPKQLRPNAISLEYRRELMVILNAAKDSLRSVFAVVPRLVEQIRNAKQHHDANEGKQVSQAIDKASENIVNTVLQPDRLERLAEKIASRTSEFNKAELSKQIKAALGVDLYIPDRGISQTVNNFVAENVALIKSIPAKYFAEVEKAITRAFANGDRWEVLSQDLQDDFDVAENSANLIARDQVGKLYGQVNNTRQQELGADSYVWRTVNDDRVREEHAERDGETYKWGELDEEPGEAINCRCYAEPDFSAVLDQVDEES